MMKLNSPNGLAIIFALTSVSSLLTRDWVAATAFAAMAAGFALSGQNSTKYFAWPDQMAAHTQPAWRHNSSMVLVGMAIVLFSFQIGQALHQAFNHLSH